MITDINELIHVLKAKLSDYLQEHGISDPLKKFSCLNPNHADTNPSMQMHKDGTFVHCFSGDCHADIFTVAHWLENKPLDGAEFVKDNVFYLADKFGIKYSIINNNNERVALKQAYYRAYKTVAEFIQKEAEANPSEAFLSEIKKRKWKKKESIDLGLGCAPGFKAVVESLRVNGFTDEFIDLAGLMRSDLFSPDGVLFTISDEYHRPVAFYMRDTKYEEKKAAFDNRDKMEASKAKVPMKYNSTSNFPGVYEKSACPYGIHDIKNFHRVIAVEGHGCKHTLRLSGIDNVVALGGLALNDQLLKKLAGLGVTHLVLTLDNDVNGKERVKSIIREFYGKCSIEFLVLDMGAVYNDVKDPDEFIRKYGVDAFKQLPERNALEWLAIVELFEKGDPYVVLQDIIPIIALERSPISRRRIETVISEMTGINKQDIHDEVEQHIASSKDRKGEVALKVLDEAKELLETNPGAIDAVMNIIESKLGALGKSSNDEELYSSNECLKEIARIKDLEDAGVEEPVILTGYHEWDKSMPLPTSEAFILIFGPPNTGKSTMCVNTALGVLENNNNSMVIIHTTDDSRKEYLGRLVSALSRLKINWVRRPGAFLDEDMSKKRDSAYKQIAEYVRQERLVVKDVIHGDTVEYHGKLLQYYRDKYPNRNIVAMCDNLHKLQTEAGKEDKARVQYISNQMKNFTTKYDCVEICTVELTKDGMYEKPKDANRIADSRALQFDANMIIGLWNEMNVLREDALLTFDSHVMERYPEVGYVRKPTLKPIIEAIILKNKLSEYKGSLFFKFHPELAVYDDITHQEVKSILDAKAKQAKEDKE